MGVAVAVLAALVVLLVALLAAELRLFRLRDRAAAEQRRTTDTQLADLRARLDTATARSAASEAERIELSSRLASAEAERVLTTDRLAAADAARAQLAARVVEHDGRAERLRREVSELRADPGAGTRGREQALWMLELARSERTWRERVAPQPGEESPFPAATDTLRLAVEVEAMALREEVGAALEIQWNAWVPDPGRCVLVLRLAQELLAAASRETQGAVLRVEGSDEVVLELTGRDEDDRPVIVTTPPVPAGVVAITAEEGVRLVVSGH